MTVIEFIHRSIADLNGAMFEDVKALTPEQLAWKPAPGANPIGFIFWHFMRVEDNNIHEFQGKPPIWESEQWYQKMGMDVKDSGMGFKEPEVDKVAALPLTDVMAYAERVVQATSDYLKTLDDTRLDYVPNPERPKRTLVVVLRSFIIAHGWWHLGEIKYLKGMQGMPFAY